MSKYNKIQGYFRNDGEDDALFHYILSVCREKRCSKAEFIREATKIHQEHTARGGFRSVSEIEDALIWRIETMLRGKTIASPAIDSAITDISEDESVLDFDPEKYGI